MKKRKSYSGEFKSNLVLHLIRGRGSLSELAQQYQIHPNQLKNWKSQFLKCAVIVLEDKRRRKKECPGRML
jgi:transposase-like protein